jgi:two-component system, NarL family, invasion response regulator UvrY
MGSVLAVDDQECFRAVVRAVVAATSSLRIVGEADSGEAAVAMADELHPDLVLMDVRMPGIGGIAATRAIKSAGAPTVVVLVSTTHPDQLRAAAEESLADAIVWKSNLRPQVLEELWQDHCPHA